MIEIAFYSPRRNKRWVLSLGHGSKSYGQSYLVTLVREEMDCGVVSWAHVVWAFPRRPNTVGERTACLKGTNDHT